MLKCMVNLKDFPCNSALFGLFWVGNITTPVFGRFFLFIAQGSFFFFVVSGRSPFTAVETVRKSEGTSLAVEKQQFLVLSWMKFISR